MDTKRRTIQPLPPPCGPVVDIEQAYMSARMHWLWRYVYELNTGPGAVRRFARTFPLRWKDDGDRVDVLTRWAEEWIAETL